MWFNAYVIKIICDYITTILAVIFVFCVTVLLPDRVKVKFRILSEHSMYIYILHFFFLDNYIDFPIFNIMIQSIAGVVIPVGVAWFVNKYHIKPIAFLFGD